MRMVYWLKFVLACCFVFLFSRQGMSQVSDEVIRGGTNGQPYPLDVSIFNLGTFLPGGGKAGVWSVPIHPGFDIGTRHYWKNGDKYSLFQVAKLGYFRHVHAQQGIQLYTGLSYQYLFTSHVFATARLGIGYLASIPDLQVFTFENGQYQRTKKIRSQFMGELNIEVGWKLFPSLDVYASYQFWLQAPFVNKYVPILPNNAVHLGVVYYHKWFSKVD